MQRVVKVGAIVAMAGCAMAGCSPANPSGRLALEPGRYMLVATPQSACVGATEVYSVGTRVTVVQDGTNWTARAESAADGSVEFRFHEVTRPNVAGAVVDGVLTGVGYDHRPFSAPGASVSFGNAVSVSAESDPAVPNWVAGTIQGPMVVSNGASSQSCSVGTIGLRPPAPCEVSADAACQ